MTDFPSLVSCVTLQDLTIDIQPLSQSWFLQALLFSLPSSLRKLSFRFDDGEELLFREENKEDWSIVDTVLASPQFSRLGCVEIRWDMGISKDTEAEHHRELMMYHLFSLQQGGIFVEIFPHLFERRILWCGSWSMSLDAVLVSDVLSPCCTPWFIPQDDFGF